MTREEEINIKSKEHFAHGWNGSVLDAFKEGAKWADENQKEGLVSIDKVCNYLKHNLPKFGSEQDKTWNENIEIFINKFKSAMKE